MESLFTQAHVTSSANGVLAYAVGGERALGRLVWVDRDGREEDIGAPTRVYGLIGLSPDGSRLAVHVGDVTDYIWLYDFARKEGRQLATSSAAGWPLWTPDGNSIAFLSWSASYIEGSLSSQPVDGGSSTTLIPSGPEGGWYATTWSSSGKIATGRVGSLGAGQFFAIEGSETERLGDAFGVFSSFSPDGNWVAYAAVTSGRGEIFVRSFPAGDVTRQFSVDGGIEPLWCPCGELFYRKRNHWMSAAVRTSPDLNWDTPREVFQTDFIDTPGRSYAISPDGRRLLVVKRAQADVRDRVEIVTNWTSLVPERVR
jgi:Tol biopolymer transport system component